MLTLPFKLERTRQNKHLVRSKLAMSSSVFHFHAHLDRLKKQSARVARSRLELSFRKSIKGLLWNSVRCGYLENKSC